MTRELQRKLGIWVGLSIAVGSTIGSGIFITQGEVALAAGSSTIAVLSWFCGGFLMIPKMMILGEMASAYPSSGEGYVYLRKAGFKPLAFLLGWTSVLAPDPAGIAIMAIAFFTFLKFLLPFFVGWMAKVGAIALILLLTGVHCTSVKKGGGLQVFLTIAKVLPLIVFVVLGIYWFDLSNLLTTNSESTMKGLLGGVSATAWAYAGLSSVCYMAGEFTNPGKVIPRSLIGGTLIVASVYTLVASATVGLLPFPDLVASETPVTDALSLIPGLHSLSAKLITIAILISILGALSSAIMYQPRLQYAMAKDGMFFKGLGKIHHLYQTPVNAILFQSGYAILLVLLTDLRTLLGYFTLMTLLNHLMKTSAVAFCRRKEDYDPKFKTPAWQLMLIVALTIDLSLVVGTFFWAPIGGLAAVGVVLITGLPAYYYWKKS